MSKKAQSARTSKGRRSKVAAAHALVTTGRGLATGAAKRAEALLALVERRKRSITEDFFEIGEALREIRKHRLYVALGFASFAELLSARKVMSVRSAEKLIEVVESVPRDRALELGPEKSYALARLAAATTELDDVESLVSRGVTVKGGKRRTVTDLSTREIEEAARAARPKPRKSEEERSADDLARQIAKAIRRRAVRGVRVEASKSSGRWSIALTVPVGSAEVLLRALE